MGNKEAIKSIKEVLPKLDNDRVYIEIYTFKSFYHVTKIDNKFIISTGGGTPQARSVEMSKKRLIERLKRGTITKVEYYNGEDMSIIWSLPGSDVRDEYISEIGSVPLREPGNFDDICGICLNVLDGKICKIDNFECRHVFHCKCLKPWSEKHYTCPICRAYGGMQEVSFFNFGKSAKSSLFADIRYLRSIKA